MTQIFASDFESGDLTGWTADVSTGQTCEVIGDAAFVGDYGMHSAKLGTANTKAFAYRAITEPTNKTICVRFWLKILSGPASDYVRLLSFMDSAGSNYAGSVRLYSSGVIAVNNGIGDDLGFYPLTEGVWYEVEARLHSDYSGSDSYLRVYVNDVLHASRESYTATVAPERLCLGVRSATNGATAEVYIDEISAEDEAIGFPANDDVTPQGFVGVYCGSFEEDSDWDMFLDAKDRLLAAGITQLSWRQKWSSLYEDYRIVGTQNIQTGEWSYALAKRVIWSAEPEYVTRLKECAGYGFEVYLRMSSTPPEWQAVDHSHAPPDAAYLTAFRNLNEGMALLYKSYVAGYFGPYNEPNAGEFFDAHLGHTRPRCHAELLHYMSDGIKAGDATAKVFGWNPEGRYINSTDMGPFYTATSNYLGAISSEPTALMEFDGAEDMQNKLEAGDILWHWEGSDLEAVTVLHVDSSTTATVTRGTEGTSQCAHSASAPWTSVRGDKWAIDTFVAESMRYNVAVPTWADYLGIHNYASGYRSPDYVVLWSPPEQNTAWTICDAAMREVYNASGGTYLPLAITEVGYKSNFYLTITLSDVAEGESVTVNGITFSAHADTTTASARQFSVSGDDAADATELQSLLDDEDYGLPDVSVLRNASILTLSSVTAMTVSTTAATHFVINDDGLDEAVAQARQAAMTIRHIVHGVTRGVQNIHLMFLYDLTSEGFFGLVTRAGETKILLDALAVFNRFFNGSTTTYVDSVVDDDYYFAYKFTSGQNTITVCWTQATGGEVIDSDGTVVTDADTTKQVPISGNSCYVYDMQGSRIKYNATGGYISLPFDNEPQYVVETTAGGRRNKHASRVRIRAGRSRSAGSTHRRSINSGRSA